MDYEWHVARMVTLGCWIEGRGVCDFGEFGISFRFFFGSSRFLDFIEGFRTYKDVLLAIIVSSYLKVYMLAMLVWEFPPSVVYIIDLIVMSSNMVALKVITESSFKGCAGVCLGAHALKFCVNWMLKEF